MEYKDLLSFYFERSNAANGLWGFYITVVLGLLAYFGTEGRAHPNHLLAVTVSIGFVGFAFVNRAAILETARARQATLSLMMKYRDSKQDNQPAIDEINRTVSPVSIQAINYFHLASDALVLIGLWVLTFYNRPAPGVHN